MYMLAKFGDHSCLIEIEISILTLILTRIPWIIHRLDPPCCKVFKTRNSNLQLQNPGYGRQKNNNKKKNTGECKAFCVSHKRNNMLRRNNRYGVTTKALLHKSVERHSRVNAYGITV